MAFATAAELSEFTGETIPATRAGRVLEMASVAVRGAAGVPIELVTDETVTLDGSGGPALLLPSWPVIAVVGVKVDGEVLASGGWAWSRAGTLERVGSVWPRRAGVVEVTYTHGYPPAEIPADVKTVTLQVAARLAANPQALTQIAADGMGGSFTKLTLTDDERDLVTRSIR